MRVLICDDEPLARDRLADLLGSIEGVELVAVATGGSEATEMITRELPDLVLLDIEMPKIDGFDVVEALAHSPVEGARAPLVCFVTAYPQFATNAFDCGALDFLCKPVRLSRLEEAVRRARRALAQREAASRLEGLAAQLDRLREARVDSPNDTSLWVHQRGQMIRIDYDALDWVEAEGEYVRLHGRDQSYLLRGSISALAEKLDGRGFTRVHRSAIVNEARIANIRSGRAGTAITLESGVEVPVGRTYSGAVRNLRGALA